MAVYHTLWGGNILFPTSRGPRTVGPSRRSWAQMGHSGVPVEAFVSDCAGPETITQRGSSGCGAKATESGASMRERASETGEVPTWCPGTSLRLSGSLCSLPATRCLPLRIARIRRKAIQVRIRLPRIPSLPRPCRVPILVGRVSALMGRPTRSRVREHRPRRRPSLQPPWIRCHVPACVAIEVPVG